MKTRFFGAVLALAAAVLSHSADAQGASRVVSFRLLCLEQQQGVITAQAVSADPGGALEIPLLTGSITPQFRGAFTKDTAQLYVADAKVPGGKRVVAEGKLASGEQQLFFLVPGPAASPMTYRIVSMNDDEKSFPMGSVRVLNLSPVAVKFTLAGAEMPPITPGGITIFPPVRTGDSWNMYQVRVDFAAPDRGWVSVSTPSWKASARKRELVVTTLDAKSKQPRIYNYKDLPPWRMVIPENER